MMAHAMSLPLGGKEAGEAYKKYLDTLLPEGMKEALRSIRKGKVPSSTVDPQQSIAQALGGFGMNMQQGRPPGKSKQKGNKQKGKRKKPTKKG